MAKGSAISKAMAGKSRTSGTHVSGLSSGRSSAKRKADGVKFGSLSRKQKQDLKEYGSLVPQEFEDDDEELGSDEETSIKKPRVVYEHELDKESEDDVSDEDVMDEDDEVEENQRPSAYSRLVGSLKKTSKHRKFYERIDREQEGREDAADDKDDNDDEDALEEEDGDVEAEAELEDEEDQDEAAVDVDDDDDEEEEEEVSDDDDEEEEKAEAKDASSDEEEIIPDYESSEDEEEIKKIPYENHFADEQPKTFDEKIAAIEQKKWIPEAFEDPVLKDVLHFAPTALDPTVKESKPIQSLDDVYVMPKIARQWEEVNKRCRKLADKKPFTPLQEKLFRHFGDYRDVLYCNRTTRNATEIRNAYVLHAMNHVFRTRHRILKTNSKIVRSQREHTDPGDLRDRGFTRPTVLIVLPFRNTVVDVVKAMVKLANPEQQQNKRRFFKDFFERNDGGIDKTKPEDYLNTFRGNIDDSFFLPITFTSRSVKFYSEVYSADVIIASPLGLRLVIGTEGDEKRNFDFLSSIETVILDQTTHFSMQNWEHVEHFFEHLNLIPKESHGCDISRIKSWYLDKKARYVRQTLVVGDFLTPEINAVFNKYMKNAKGKLKIKQRYEEGTIVDVVAKVPQTFTRIDALSLSSIDDMRFKYFIEKTLPSLRRSAIMQNHTLIFIPSYFDFVRIRNYLEENKYSYEPACEYTSSSAIARARTQFFHGRTDFILYTERLHFFRRFNIRGAFHLVLYGLPENPQFYSEIVNFLSLKLDEASAAEEATFSCTTLFSKYDHLKLERVVGTARAKKMCTSQRNNYSFS